ncbi:MAG: transposase, partial [Clostridiales bacterium]|nr:transposase [Clostridiales bacterium]
MHLAKVLIGYEKNSVAGNNLGNSCNGYSRKTITSDYGECEIVVPRDRNVEFEPRIIEKCQTRTDEIEQKILAQKFCLRKTRAVHVPTSFGFHQKFCLRKTRAVHVPTSFG